INVKNVPLEEVLDKILEDANLTYRIRSGTITIVRAPAKAQVNRMVQQQVEVRGQVADSLGTLYGVSVIVKGNPTIGTSTDVNGRYTLMVPQNAVLVYQFIGYHTQELPINGRSIIDVVLKQDLT